MAEDIRGISYREPKEKKKKKKVWFVVLIAA
jgi:hypothetical protein